MPTIYKICSGAEWRAAKATGVYVGSAVDRRDGFIHFSTAAQVGETARRHFAQQEDLLLVAVDEDRLGTSLRYEAARGGSLFPHLYGTLDLAAVVWVKPLPLGPAGAHVLPDLA
jgi:uncharacterized protein (DUF952 family)